MRVVLLVVVLLLPVLCLAIPTGLNMMPTAESLGMGSTRTDYESSGSGKLYVPSIDNSLYGVQVGLLLGLEGGVDHVTNKGTVYNAKWRFTSDGTFFPALAVGVQDFGSGDKPQYYLVATKSLVPLVGQSLGNLKVHAGVMRDTAGYNNILMYGASGGFGPVIVKADRVTGSAKDGESVSTGLAIGSSITVTGTYYWYRDETKETTASVSYLFKAL